MYRLTNIKINELIKIDNLTIPGQSVTCILGPSGSGNLGYKQFFNQRSQLIQEHD